MTERHDGSQPRRGSSIAAVAQRVTCWIVLVGLVVSACANRAPSRSLPASPAPQTPTLRSPPPTVAPPTTAVSASPANSGEALPSPGFSWSVSGAASVITLVGSIHVGFDGLYPLPERVESAFRESTTLAMELALDQEPPERVAELMINGAMLPKGKSLRDCLSNKTWIQYQTFAKQHADQAQFFSRFRPWFVAVFLSGEQATVDGYDPNQGIDLHFFNQRGNRRVIGVEKAEDHVKLLADLPAATQELMLAEQLDAMNKKNDELEALVGLWKTGDAEGLAHEMFAEFDVPEYGPVYDALIVQRNNRMTKLIESWLKGQERIFVVLGAGHFVGKDGIVAQLQRDGWRPARI